MPATSSQKRKANDDPPGEDSDRPAPALRKDASSVQPRSHALHLPAPMWGHVLDYLPYGEVRSALLVGKIIANEAVKYVRALNIMKACQMDGPATRRFPNVGELNVLCLVRFDDEEIDTARFEHSLCQETANKFVPFLSFFGKLERVFAGGFVSLDSPIGSWLKRTNPSFKSHVRFNPRRSNEYNDNSRRFLALIEKVLGAYKVRLLPNIKSMGGFITYLDDLRECEPDGSCTFCGDVCRYFSVKNVLDVIRNKPDLLCMGWIESLRILWQRADGKSEITNCSLGVLTELLNNRMNIFQLGSGSEVSKAQKDLRKRLEKAGCTAHYWSGIQFLTRDGLSEIDSLAEVGFDPRTISREELYHEIKVGMSNRAYDVLVKSTFDALVARGFAFDEKDLIILDETKEPALSDIPALIRRVQD